MMNDDYELLDSGDGRKLERFGKYVLARPCSQAMWRPCKSEADWNRADASFDREDGNHWHGRGNLPKEWTVETAGIRFKLGGTDFGHLGIFPEQREQWRWIRDEVERRCGGGRGAVSVLNLFAYTGGATAAAAKAGAAVCHVDAAKGMVAAAKENLKLSGLEDAPVRYIVDDCKKFVEREIRRGHKYDGIIMDPPSYGRGPGGEVWKLEECAHELITLAARLMSDEPLFFLVNSYTTGLSPMTMGYMVMDAMELRGKVCAEELGLHVTQTGLYLPAGASARWTAESEN